MTHISSSSSVSTDPWPRTFLTAWSVSEMDPTQRRPHVLKHVYHEREQWWDLDIHFTSKDRVAFEDEACEHDIRVWFSPEAVGEYRSGPSDAWLNDWPSSLIDQLDQRYLSCYRPYTERVMEEVERGVAAMYNDEVKGRLDAVLLLDRHGVLVVLKVISLDRHDLRWVSTYRPMIPQKKLSAQKKFRALVRSLKEAMFY